jgi:hypothetical protein
MAGFAAVRSISPRLFTLEICPLKRSKKAEDVILFPWDESFTQADLAIYLYAEDRCVGLLLKSGIMHC